MYVKEFLFIGNFVVGIGMNDASLCFDGLPKREKSMMQQSFCNVQHVSLCFTGEKATFTFITKKIIW